MTNPYGQPQGQPYPPQGQPYPPPGGYAPPSGPQPMPPGMPPQQQGGYPQSGGFPQQGYPQQPQQPPAPMGPQMPPPPPGMGRIVVDSGFFVMAFILYLFKPGITINGQPGPVATWGKTVIDLPPGQYQIQVQTNYLWQFGQAVAVVPVNAGQTVDVYYKAPALPFGEGAIGPVPQSVPNLGLALGIMIGSWALAILVILVSLLSM